MTLVLPMLTISVLSHLNNQLYTQRTPKYCLEETTQGAESEHQGSAGLDAQAKADLIVNIFLGVENGGIHYYDVQLKEIENDGAGWYQINVLAYFQYDRIA